MRFVELLAGLGFATFDLELLGHRDVRTTMRYLHVLTVGALGVKSPMDRL